MLTFLKKFFKPKHPPTAEAPYKVETPKSVVVEGVGSVEVPAVKPPGACGCGRSPTGLCVGLHAVSEANWAVHADNPNKSVAKKKATVTKAKSAAPKTAAKPKKPRAPKAPKASA